MTIDGLSDVDDMLGELPKATAKAVLRRVGIKALQPMAETARSLAPDDPATPDPDLESSITVGTKLNKSQAREARKDEGRAFVTVYMGTNDPAGVQQEFGNENHGPQPFMRPAFAQDAQGAIKIVADELGDEIMKTVARRAKRAARKG
jgi:HK97 gp10 family phage protein